MAAEPARITPEVARQAAHWHMLMLDPGTSPAQRESCARWRAAAPEHERAWQKAQRVQARLGLLPPQLAMGTLNRERRQVMKQLLVLALVAPAGYAGFRQVSPAGDYSTAIGERRRLTLADGTVLQLNTRTVVDVDFDEHQRLITLRRGEILLDSGHDPQHRPLRVASEQGVIEALGTRFLVRQRDGRTQVSVFEGAVRVTPTNQRVDAGQQLVFDGKNRSPITPAREQDSQWIRGQLIVEAMPLRDFLGELGRYRNGWLRCQDEVAPLLISGAFQLDNTDAILAALPATLPVRVGYRTRYWVTVTQR